MISQEKKENTQKSIFILKKEYANIIFELAKGEGSTMTFSQTLATIHNQPVLAKPREITLVINLKKGLDYILDLLDEDRMKFSKYNLCAINNLVSSDDNQDNLGDFRKGTIRIAGSKHTGVNPLIAQDAFDMLEKSFNEGPKTNEAIIKLALNLFKHQFFGDGNKRTAQLMMNGLLVKYNFVPFVLNFNEQKNIDALLTYYEMDEAKPLYDICLKSQNEIKNAYQIVVGDTKKSFDQILREVKHQNTSKQTTGPSESIKM
ncbi:hypothetical protein A6A19_00285 [Actinobacillus delphinicola]|uniref:Fic family protein n=1 Tax=Actinobacillus delphinicola TaxID=51161 RepID=UPI0024427C9A|nr:Fic family protein [Actinobacillus delphinicola]MDG6896483.1 hypothetical protein [Actinobacillus delphinicola]